MYGTDASQEVCSVLAAVRKAEKKTDEEWLKSLSPRKLDEIKFHDTIRETHRIDADHGQIKEDCLDAHRANKKYYSTTRRSHDYVNDWIAANAKGRVFLDQSGNPQSVVRYTRKAGSPDE